jgi:hypothetical protein
MADGSDAATTQSLRPYSAGDILIWTIGGSTTASALELAAEMGSLAAAHELGAWGVADRGLGSQAYFDLTLNDQVDVLTIKVIFGSLPGWVY